MPARHHRRAAVDADRIDRHLRRQDRHRRRLREARRAHRVDERRQARGDRIAGAPLQSRRGQEARRAAAGVLRPVRGEGRRSSRHSTPEKIDALAQGRVWTGQQAKEHGLVDELGGLDRAIALAKERAKIPADAEVELVVYPPRKSFYELLSDQVNGDERLGADGQWLSASLSKGELEVLRTMRGPLATFRRGEPLALDAVQFLR